MFYVYILASKRNGTLYVGMTDDLVRRMEEHKGKAFKGFTAKYGVTQLVCSKITQVATWLSVESVRSRSGTGSGRLVDWADES